MVPPEIAEGAGAYPAPPVDTPMKDIYYNLKLQICIHVDIFSE